MCHMYGATGQRIDGARFLTETFVPGAYYFNLAAEADAQGRRFTAFGLYLAGDVEFGLTVLTAAEAREEITTADARAVVLIASALTPRET